MNLRAAKTGPKSGQEQSKSGLRMIRCCCKFLHNVFFGFKLAKPRQYDLSIRKTSSDVDVGSRMDKPTLR